MRNVSFLIEEEFSEVVDGGIYVSDKSRYMYAFDQCLEHLPQKAQDIVKWKEEEYCISIVVTKVKKRRNIHLIIPTDSQTTPPQKKKNIKRFNSPAPHRWTARRPRPEQVQPTDEDWKSPTTVPAVPELRMAGITRERTC